VRARHFIINTNQQSLDHGDRNEKLKSIVYIALSLKTVLLPFLQRAYA